MTTPIPFPADRVVDVLIVGAGVCGLALARQLGASGHDVLVVEARERLGGRVLTQHCAATGQALDLGPRWFWRDTEPRITALLAELGLASTPQHDPGDALWLTDPNRTPDQRNEPDGVHAGARYIDGGSVRLINALAAQLPPGCVRTGVAVQALRDQGAWIEVQLATGRPLRARQVVLAVPPRLVHEKIKFVPELPEAIDAALAQTPTWMAAQARSVTTFAQPFWRDAGQSGNAFVRHAQAVLAEVFDSSQADKGGALGGFVALNAEQRESFKRGLPLLIDSQLAQLFGAQAQDGHLYLQDWATEPWTCSAIDRASPPELPINNPLLRQPLWSGRVFLGGTETAAHGAGHMEGALEAADRIAHAIGRARSDAASTPAPLGVADSRPTALGQFATAVQALRGLAPERYRQHLTQLLSSQQTELLTQRALLATADQVYSEALARLDALLPALDAASAEVLNGRHALSPALLAAFDGWNKGLLDAALGFNGSSCALSNFAQEHHPDADTLRAITLDLAAAWREFALEINDRLLNASGLAELA